MEERPHKRTPGRFNFAMRPSGSRGEAPRKFSNPKTPSPFPQKPPYRPGEPARASTHAGGQKITPLQSKLPKKFAKTRTPKTQYVKYPPKQATASWGAVATWYDKHLTSSDTYHEKVILPNLLRLIEPQKGEQVLDLACGEGFFARAFAAKGAVVAGLDISPELIALAKKKAGTGITYNVGSADDLSRFRNEQFHKAVIVLAIQNIEHMQKVFTEAVRVTKKNGLPAPHSGAQAGALHIVMNHPAFRIPKQSSWGYDEKSGVQFRRVDQYISESRTAIDMHPGMKDSPQTISFHRPLQYYVKALVKAGFVVDRFEEWISHKDSNSGPRAQAENRSRKEIPLFLYIRARKI